MVTNQRLRLFQISHKWNSIPKTTGLSLNAKVYKWDYRDRKYWNKPIAFINKYTFDFYEGDNKEVNSMSMEEQKNNYKYIIYVQGHSAADRYGNLMSGDNIIFKINSTCSAKDMWFFPKLNGD